MHQVGLDTADDRTVWEFAKTGGFTIVTLDSDFGEMGARSPRGPRPFGPARRPIHGCHRKVAPHPRRGKCMYASLNCIVRAGASSGYSAGERGRCYSLNPKLGPGFRFKCAMIWEEQFKWTVWGHPCEFFQYDVQVPFSLGDFCSRRWPAWA